MGAPPVLTDEEIDEAVDAALGLGYTLTWAGPMYKIIDDNLDAFIDKHTYIWESDYDKIPDV